MQVNMVSFPKEYDQLAAIINKTSLDKHQSVSKTIRDMLCDAIDFTPTEKEIQKRNRSRKLKH